MRTVVVGGGIAGVSTVAALRTGGYEGEIVLVEPAAFPYDRPPLSKQFLAGERELEQIALQPPEWYAAQRVELLTGTSVTAIRPDAGEAVLADGAVLAADHLVLATGARPIVPRLPGIEQGILAGRVHVLREYEDAAALRAALVPGARLLILGGGLIGAEVASTARGLDGEITIADPLDPPSAAALGPDVAGWLHGLHAARGVEVVTASVASLEVTEPGIAAQLVGEAEPRTYDHVLVGVGIRPDTALADAAGLASDDGILTGPGQTTSHPRVLAVGDCARPRDERRTEHWEAAERDGRRAAATILGTPAPSAGAPWFWTDRYGLHVECVGSMTAGESVVRGTFGEPPFAVFSVHAGRVTGAVGVDDPKAVRAARRMIDREVVVDPAALADQGSDLRKLLRG